jgi:Tfp pilus assembly protein PilF
MSCLPSASSLQHPLSRRVCFSTGAFRRARLHFARGRVFWETRKADAARVEFLKALEFVPNFLPALQGVAEVLLTQKHEDDAAGFIERALKASPMDSFSLSMKAEIHWRRGQVQEAVETMSVVVRAQPENPTFLFRLGRFLQQSGMIEEAYSYFRRAKAGDQSFVDPRLSLASTAIDLGRLGEAKAEIESLRTSNVPLDKRFVVDEIEAKYHLALDEVDAASELAGRALNYHRNTFTLSLMAKVEVDKSKRARTDGMLVMAESHLGRAIQLINEAIAQDPKSQVLLRQLEALKSAQLGGDRVHAT